MVIAGGRVFSGPPRASGLIGHRPAGREHRYASRCLYASPGLRIVGRVIDVFDALGAPARRAILDVLAARDDQTLFEIVNRLLVDHDLDLTRQAISQHLAVLEEAGLVRSRRDGRYRFHTLDIEPLREAMVRWLDKE